MMWVVLRHVLLQWERDMWCYVIHCIINEEKRSTSGANPNKCREPDAKHS